MILYTERLILRPWTAEDADSLYEYAKNPDVGPIAGWPAHKSVEESLDVIKNVFNGKECYAICEKENNIAIGAIELKLNGHTDMTECDDECELGMTTIWIGYYDGNHKSKRVQEKLGFAYHHTCDEVDVPLLGEVRVGHTNYMTKEMWEKN